MAYKFKKSKAKINFKQTPKVHFNSQRKVVNYGRMSKPNHGVNSAIKSITRGFKQSSNYSKPRSQSSSYSGRSLFQQATGNRKTISHSPIDRGVWRLNQQKGLKSFGDKDRDSIRNILDCQPRNKFRQGPENNLDPHKKPAQQQDSVLQAEIERRKNVAKWTAGNDVSGSQESKSIWQTLAGNTKQKLNEFMEQKKRDFYGQKYVDPAVAAEAQRRADSYMQERAINEEKARLIKEANQPHYASDPYIMFASQPISALDAVRNQGRTITGDFKKASSQLPDAYAADQQGFESRKMSLQELISLAKQKRENGFSKIASLLGKNLTKPDQGIIDFKNTNAEAQDQGLPPSLKTIVLLGGQPNRNDILIAAASPQRKQGAKQI